MNKPLISPFSSPATLRQDLRQQILCLQPDQFESVALAIFRYQSTHNSIYREYIRHLTIQQERIQSISQIPFMPIGFFKQHRILTAELLAPDLTTALLFESSGTTGTATSRHYVMDPALYEAVSQYGFEQVYGPLERFHILALLPSYLERNNSSLVYMVQRFIEKTDRSSQSSFFLRHPDELTSTLKVLANHPDGRPILLIGVTFGLLNWVESGIDFAFLRRLPQLIVMETGGMKGRRQELLREEVHAILTQRLGVPVIHSEYGMTELLSQAYSTGRGIFYPSATLKVYLRDLNDPFHIHPVTYKRVGGINVVDLANLDSCSFIETQDLGQYVTQAPGAFQVLGRFDNTDLRGCNLMVG